MSKLGDKLYGKLIELNEKDLRSKSEEFRGLANSVKDEFAKTIDWHPLNFSSGSLEQKRLIHNADKITYKYRLGEILTMVAVLGTICYTPLHFFLTPLTAGAITLIIIALALLADYHKVEFNLKKGVFLRGCIEINLNDIYSVQLFKFKVYDSDGDYYNFQLNIILNDSRRFHILNYGGGSVITARRDAQIISNAINKPLWDVTEYTL